jgi:hypothetical protein
MKIVSASLAICLCVGLALFAPGCGLLNSGSSSSANTFYTNAANTTPVFKPSSASGAGVNTASSSWESGNPLYSVYYSLREFISSRDEGHVDRSNIYKLLIDVDSVFSGLSGSAGSITAQSVTPPFAGLPAVTCNQAYNDTSGRKAIAMTETTVETSAIISWIWGSGGQEEYGIAALVFNKSTHDITIDMTYSVDYNLSDTATDYNMRCHVTGNPNTNTFQYKYLIGDRAIVAQGVSQGAGNYMLFKYKGDDNAVKYIVASAEAGESYFKAENTTPANIYGTTEVNNLPASVATYQNWVVSTNFFSSSDLVTNLNQLNIGNSKAGTIYINYQ